MCYNMNMYLLYIIVNNSYSVHQICGCNERISVLVLIIIDDLWYVLHVVVLGQPYTHIYICMCYVMWLYLYINLSLKYVYVCVDKPFVSISANWSCDLTHINLILLSFICFLIK